MKRHSRTLFFLLAVVITIVSFLPLEQVFGQVVPPIFVPLFTTYQDPEYAFGMDGGTVENVIVDPDHPEVVYAGTWGNGIYKSLDGGKTWEIHITDGLQSPYIYEIAIDPLNSNHLLASVYTHGIDQSFDGGMTWEPVIGFPDYAVIYSIDFDSSIQLEDPFVRSSTVYAAIREKTIGNVYPGGVWKSTDGGDEWQQVTFYDNGFEQEDYIYDLAVHPNNPQIIYTANHRTGIYKTKDGGANWMKVSDGLVHQDIRGIQVNPVNGRVYAGIWDGFGFAFSDDYGATWTNNLYTDNLNLYVYEIQYDPYQPDNVYLTTASGVYYCEAPSKYSVCSLIGSEGKFVFDLALDLSSPQAGNGRTKVMYSALQHFGLFKSENGGFSFDPSYRGIRANIVRAITIDPTNPDIQYVSTSYRGLFRSSDSGATWKSLHYALDLEFINDILIDPNSPSTIYVGDKYGAIYYSLDDGETWQPGNVGITRSVSSDEEIAEIGVTELRIDESDYEWMDSVDLEDLMDAVDSVSTDRATIATISTVGFDPEDSNKMFAGKNPGGMIYSDVGGLSWHYSDLKTGGVLDSLVDPSQTGKYLIGMTDVGVMVSEDRIAWTKLGTELPSGVDVYALARQDDGVYLAGTDQGVYRLNLSGGVTWETIGFSDFVRDLVVDPTNSDMIWLATLEGLYYGLPTGVDGAYEWTKKDLDGSNNERMIVIEIVSVSGTTREFSIGMDGGDVYHLIVDLLP